jgi:hypothetical protein
MPRKCIDGDLVDLASGGSPGSEGGLCTACGWHVTLHTSLGLTWLTVAQGGLWHLSWSGAPTQHKGASTGLHPHGGH